MSRESRTFTQSLYLAVFAYQHKTWPVVTVASTTGLTTTRLGWLCQIPGKMSSEKAPEIKVRCAWIRQEGWNRIDHAGNETQIRWQQCCDSLIQTRNPTSVVFVFTLSGCKVIWYQFSPEINRHRRHSGMCPVFCCWCLIVAAFFFLLLLLIFFISGVESWGWHSKPNWI